MNKWVIVPIVIILAVSTIFNGVFYLKESGRLEDARAEIAALQSDLSALVGNVSGIDGDLSTLEGNVSGLEGNVSGLEGNLSTLEGNVSGIEGDVFGLGGNLSNLEGNVSGLEGNLSTLEGNVSTLEGNLSTLENDVLTLEPYGRAVLEVVAMLEPSIVSIELIDPNLVEEEYGSGLIATGTGVIITGSGYVLTNNHVIDEPGSITVTLMDKEAYVGTIAYVYDILDIAIVKISSDRTDFPAAVLGSSADVAVGEQVVAVGYPLLFDLGGPATFTVGIISAVRTFDNNEFIQTDAAINPGNSGGALVNLRGEVIGITTSKYIGGDIDNLAFAIPIDDIQPFPEGIA